MSATFPAPHLIAAPQPDPLTLGDDGKPPRTRIKDANSLHQIYSKNRNADTESAWSRKNVQEMFDGEPPLNQTTLKNMGQGHLFNLNFGEAASRKESALTAYHDMIHSVDVMCRFRFPAKIDPTLAADKAQVIAEEYHWTIMNWNQFDFRFQLLSDHFVGHGVGIAYFDNDVDWRFMVSGLGDFLMPRGTPASEEDIECVTAVRKYPAHKLYSFIEDEKSAKSAGWNIEAVKEAILQAAHGKATDASQRFKQWEEFQQEVKNNDLTVGYAKAQEVRVVHGWVREFNQKVSHYIIDEAGQLKEFLFKKENRFDNIDQCFVTFTYGVGNGCYHGIRGMGYKMFNHVQASNRLQNLALNAAHIEMSVLMQAEDGEDMNTLGLVAFGPVTVIPPGLKISEHQFANKSKEALPLIQHLALQIDNNTGSYRTRAIEPTGQERTKFEVQAQLQHEGQLSSAAMTLFYVPWKRLHAEMFRRMIKAPDKEARDFRKRCEERGVTLEDLKTICEVIPVKAVGAGSAQMRLLAFDELLQISGALDEVGRNRLLRDKIASRVGASMVDRYLPRLEVTTGRPPIDAKIAMLENSAMEQGEEFPVTMGEAHAVHAEIHMSELARQVQGTQEGQLDPQKTVPFFMGVIPHMQQTLRAIMDDPLRVEQTKAWAKQLSQLANAARRIHQMLMEQMEYEQRQLQQQAQGGGMDAEGVAKLQKAEADMQMQREKHEQKLQLRMEDVYQKMQLRDLQTAQKLRERSAMTRTEGVAA